MNLICNNKKKQNVLNAHLFTTKHQKYCPTLKFNMKYRDKIRSKQRYCRALGFCASKHEYI